MVVSPSSFSLCCFDWWMHLDLGIIPDKIIVNYCDNQFIVWVFFQATFAGTSLWKCENVLCIFVIHDSKWRISGFGFCWLDKIRKLKTSLRTLGNRDKHNSIEWFVVKTICRQQSGTKRRRAEGHCASLTWSSSIFFMAALLVPPTTSLSRTLYQLPITGPFNANQTESWFAYRHQFSWKSSNISICTPAAH